MFGAAAALALVNSIVNGIAGYFRDQAEVAKAKLAIEGAVVDFMRQVDTGQIELNKQDSQSPSFFVSGWRPFIGWMGGIAIGYQFLLRPVFDAITLYFMPSVPALPAADLNEIIGLVTAMLGVAGLRTYEKVKGINS